MTGSHVVSLLSKKYAKLAGEYELADRMTEDAVGLSAIIAATEQSDRRKKELMEQLEAIEVVIWMYDPEWNPAAIRPASKRVHHKLGALSRAAYAILRAAKVGLTTREIAKLAMERLGLDLTDQREIRRVENAVNNALSGREGRAVRKVSYDPIRWEAIEREKALPRTIRSVRKAKPSR